MTVVSKSLVSVLIPVYNEQEWIRSTLMCVNSQTWPHIEVIIVDDGSTDESLEIAKDFESKRIKVIGQRNLGACAARNRALQEAQGDYIQYMDADDLMEADKIEKQVCALRGAPRDAVSATRWTRFYKEIGDGPHPPVPEEWKHEDPFDWLIEAQAGRTMMHPMGWLTPRSVVEKAGPWDEDLLVNQDGEYFARVLLNAQRVVFCSDTAVYYRSGLSSSVSGRSSGKALRSQYEAAEKITQLMLQHEDSERVSQACADAFQRIVYDAYPTSCCIAQQAANRVKELGGSSAPPPGDGRIFKMVGRIFGWKKALQLQHFYRKIAYKEK